MPSSAFPASALTWLVDAPGAHVLALGRSAAPLVPMLAARGDRVTVNDPDPARVQAIVRRTPGVLPTVSQPHRLPFAPCSFDVAVVNRTFHLLDLATVVPEIARVLRPGGLLGVSYTIRDDSVPWVKRLVRLLQQVDPDAMTQTHGADAPDRLADNPYFPHVERTNYRRWVPITRDGLIDMVARRFPGLDADLLIGMLTEVGRLYDSSARAPEPLLLPYRVSCWRAAVDHTEFTSQLRRPDDGLSITL